MIAAQLLACHDASMDQHRSGLSVPLTTLRLGLPVMTIKTWYKSIRSRIVSPVSTQKEGGPKLCK